MTGYLSQIADRSVANEGDNSLKPSWVSSRHNILVDPFENNEEITAPKKEPAPVTELTTNERQAFIPSPVGLNKDTHPSPEKQEPLTIENNYITRHITRIIQPAEEEIKPLPGLSTIIPVVQKADLKKDNSARETIPVPAKINERSEGKYLTPALPDTPAKTWIPEVKPKSDVFTDIRKDLQDKSLSRQKNSGTIPSISPTPDRSIKIEEFILPREQTRLKIGRIIVEVLSPPKKRDIPLVIQTPTPSPVTNNSGDKNYKYSFGLGQL